MFTVFRCREHNLNLLMDKSGSKLCLDKLYKSESVKNTVRDVLGEDFEASFESLMRQAHLVKSLLMKTAKKYKNSLRLLFIEFGYELETLEHLKIMLDALKLYDVDEEDEVDEVDGEKEVLQSQSNKTV